MGEKLKSSPLIEALCQFIFEPSEGADWTLPGRMYDLIKGDFPLRSQARGLKMQVQMGQESKAKINTEDSIQRVQLRREDESAMVQVGPNLLVINHLCPYENWETFRDLILQMFSHYTQLYGEHQLRSLALRYINQIVVTKENRDIAKYLTTDPPLSGSLDKSLAGFYQLYEIVQEDPPGLLLHQTGSRRKDEQDLIVLDLEYQSKQGPEVKNKDQVKAWLNKAHEVIEDAFIDSLNNDYYEHLRDGG